MMEKEGNLKRTRVMFPTPGTSVMPEISFLSNTWGSSYTSSCCRHKHQRICAKKAPFLLYIGGCPADRPAHPGSPAQPSSPIAQDRNENLSQKCKIYIVNPLTRISDRIQSVCFKKSQHQIYSKPNFKNTLQNQGLATQCKAKTNFHFSW